MFSFYTIEGATALRDALRSFDHGRLVVNMVDLPVKCPGSTSPPSSTPVRWTAPPAG